MDFLSQILFFISLICVIGAVDTQNDFETKKDTVQQAYDVNNLLRKSLFRIHNSLKFKEQPVELKFNELLTSEEYFFENSTKCVRDISYIITNLKEKWVIKMLDSYGKPDSGILEGSTHWPGDYSECVNVLTPPNNSSNFQGQYCSLTQSWKSANWSLSLVAGVCIPDSCSTADHLDVLQLLNPMGVEGNASFSSLHLALDCKPTQRHLNAPAGAVIALLSVFCALALLGSSVTAAKYFTENTGRPRRTSLAVNIPAAHPDTRKNADADDELLLLQPAASPTASDGCLTFLSCFCVFSNGAKLLNTKTSEGELLCIHGIRFLSMSWVILGHSYLFCFAEIKNILESLQLISNLPFQIVLQGFYSVDSFFVLSGFLLTYLSMQEFEKTKGKLNWAYFYVHRYLRLTPVYMITLGFSATVFMYLGAGPFWPKGDVDPVCRDYWWWNLLYINNFATQQCMGWSWYLANDMQFFIISPVILIALWRWPKVGVSILSSLVLMCWLANFFITYIYDLPAGVAGIIGLPMDDVLQAAETFADYFQKLYIKPYTRIAPYLIGMFVGYLLSERKRNSKPKHGWAALCSGWIIASTITLACVYGLYHQDLSSVVARSIYNALSRTAFAIGLSWVIYVCLMDQGGFVNAILSYKFFIPLSRLTYVAYLIHPMIITGYFSSLKTTFVFSHPSEVFLYLGIMVVTYALSIPVALVLESPIIALEKMIRKSLVGQQRPS